MFWTTVPSKMLLEKVWDRSTEPLSSLVTVRGPCMYRLVHFPQISVKKSCAENNLHLNKSAFEKNALPGNVTTLGTATTVPSVTSHLAQMKCSHCPTRDICTK